MGAEQGELKVNEPRSVTILSVGPLARGKLAQSGLDLFNLFFEPFTILVDHDGHTDEEAFVAKGMFSVVPSRPSKHPPNLAVTLAAKIASECRFGSRRISGHGQTTLSQHDEQWRVKIGERTLMRSVLLV